MSSTTQDNVIRITDGKPQIEADDWVVIRDLELSEAATRPTAETHAILPFRLLQNMGEVQRSAITAVWISPDDDFEATMDWLGQMQLIAIDFPSFRDGRGYSIGYLLRTRYGWKGELRAIGDILRDQLNYMRRCGFNTFALRADKNIQDALKSFSRYSVQYQGGVDEPLPLFRRRST